MSEGDFIDIDTSAAVEPKPVPSGEYKLRCLGVKQKEGDDWKGLSLTLEIIEAQDDDHEQYLAAADLLYHMEWLPTGGGTPRQNNARQFAFGQFKAAFGFAADESFQLNDLVGREPWAMLSQRDDDYGRKNVVSKWTGQV